MPTTPTTPTSDWSSLGCFSDSVAARTLTEPRYDVSPVTVETCQAACQASGYLLAGVEYGVECYCGNEFSNGGAPAMGGCDMPCDGDASETCGGSARLNVYTYEDSCTVSGCTAATAALPTTVQTSGDWTYIGCYSDDVNSRTFPTRVGTTGDVTVESCVAACAAAGYNLAGIEYSSECYCDNDVVNGTLTTDGRCDMACQGDTSEVCGGPDGLSVYEVDGYTPPSLVPPPPPPSIRPSGTPQCCLSVEAASGASDYLNSHGIYVSDPATQVALYCTDPVGSTCDLFLMCCDDTSYGGVASIGCSWAPS